MLHDPFHRSAAEGEHGDTGLYWRDSRNGPALIETFHAIAAAAKRARGSSWTTSSAKIRAGLKTCSSDWPAFILSVQVTCDAKELQRRESCARTARRTGSTPNVRRVPSMCRSPAR
ncbi:MAG: hypothetical protein ACLSAH_20145 [Bilophila wadsworthia]